MKNPVEKEIEELEAQLENAKGRLPKHSLRPSLMIEIEDLEEKIAEARRRLQNIRSGFTHAIVRTPSRTFASGLTSGQYGFPDYNLTLIQHQAYCRALVSCGLTLTILDPEEQYPDSTFVEDTAVLTKTKAIFTHPGADSRTGEVALVKPVVEGFFEHHDMIKSPGTLDGGDICEADDHFFIGISYRTNEEGAHQLAEILRGEGYTTTFIDIRGIPGILHLKSGIAYIGDHSLVVVPEIEDMKAFQDYTRIRVEKNEAYAANCIRVNDNIIIPEGFHIIKNQLEQRGYTTLSLDMSEFQKMDGGLSCLSLRI